MSKEILIGLDPGHGMNDPGAVGNGMREKDLTLDIAKRTAEYLKDYEGAKVVLTRVDDTTFSVDKSTDLTARAKFANLRGVDAFYSIHINAAGGTGFETFTFSKRAVTAVHKKIAKVFTDRGMPDRGQKVKNLAVLRLTNMPSQLIEYGFIDHPTDSSFLKQQNFLDTAARATAEGIAEDLNLKKKSTAETPKEDEDMEDIKVYVNGKLEKGIGKLSKEGRTYLQVSALNNKRVSIEKWDNKTKTLRIKTE